MTEGKLIVITGPSGVGKGTLVQGLLDRHPELYFSVSVTTRHPRPGEVDGVNYHFTTRDGFETMIREQALLEWAEYTGNYYGTPYKPVEAQIKLGKRVILEIELVGARQIKSNLPEAVSIFVLPPSEAELERRLRNRATDSQASMNKRLERAKLELEAACEFDYQIVNDNLEETVKILEKVIFAT